MRDKEPKTLLEVQDWYNRKEAEATLPARITARNFGIIPMDLHEWLTEHSIAMEKFVTFPPDWEEFDRAATGIMRELGIGMISVAEATAKHDALRTAHEPVIHTFCFKDDTDAIWFKMKWL